MENISQLLQEAKPLYFKRKRIKRQIISTFSVIFMVGTLSFLSYKPTTYNYNIDISATTFEYIYFDYPAYEETNFIEEMGLPTDEYGFLRAV